MIALAPTLFLFGAFMLSLLSAFIFVIWRSDPDAEELWWWAAAFATSAGSALCFAFRHEAEALSIVLGNALLLWADGLLWTGVAVFVGKPSRPLAASFCGLVWLAGLWRLDIHLRIAAIAAFGAIYELLAVEELRRYNRDQRERIVSSHVAAWIIAIQAAFDIVFVISIPFLDVAADRFVDSAYLKWRFFELAGYGAILGFLLATLSKERLASRREIAATIDPLTGLHNRRAFDRAVARAGKSVATQATAVLVFDLDNFKYINDSFGHAIGDRVLTAFAETAARNIRAGDMLARVGGEEFVAVLAPADRQAASAIAERIRATFLRDASHLADGTATVSVGVTVLEKGAPDLAAMLRVADDALYRAKAEGRNKVVFADA